MIEQSGLMLLSDALMGVGDTGKRDIGGGGGGEWVLRSVCM